LKENKNNNSNYKRLILNTIWGSGSFLFITIISFFILPFIVQKLSVSGYGIYILITSIVGYYGILDLGLGNALIKYVSEFYEKEDFWNLNLYINSTIIFLAIIGILTSSLIVYYSNGILQLLNIKSDQSDISKSAIQIASLGFFFTFLSSGYKSALQGLQLFKITSLVDSFSILILNILLLVTLSLGYGLLGAIIVNVFIAIFTFFIFFIYLNKKLLLYKFSFFIDLNIIKKIFGFSLFVFFSKLSNIFATYIVRFVIAFFLGPIAVTYYIVPSKLVGAIGGISSSAIATIFPFTSQMEANGDENGIKNMFLRGASLFTALTLPVILFTIIFSQPILTVWMGNDFAEKTWMVLGIITFSGFIGSLSAIPNLIILGKGNSKLIGLFSIVTIVLYILFMPILTKYFGIIGASISLLISSLGVIILVIKKTTHFINVSIKEYFNLVIKPHLIFFITAICLLVLLRYFQHLNEYLLIGTGFLLMSLQYGIYFFNNTIPLKIIIARMQNKK